MRLSRIKLVMLVTASLALVGPVLAWVFIDAPTAALFLAATAVICICAAMPVVFSVMTRRNDLRRLEREEAEEIRLGEKGGPHAPAGDQGRADEIQK
jgi:phosphotransferase system  glucose/maltose/N-acetylglucosamine-specific IIC component